MQCLPGIITDKVYALMTVREREDLWRLQTDGIIEGQHVYQTTKASNALRKFIRDINKKYL